MKSKLHTLIASLSLVFSIAAVNGAAQTSPSRIENITIKNFGQMSEGYYRGGQPKEEEFQSLKSLGVETVIDLQEKPKKFEKALVESLGMTYINIPMDDDEYPRPENIERFLQLMNDPSTGVVFVHCKGGKHRTGVTGAAYRFTKNDWNYDQVYREMLNYDFHTRWGRGVMKDFVKDYAEKIEKMKTERTPAAEVQTLTN